MNLVWVHHDAISREHPVFAEAGEGARAVFIFDAESYRRRGYTFKRLLFILECVEDAGFEVVEGEYLDALRDLAPTTIFAARTPDPDFKAVLTGARAFAEVRTVKERPFARLNAEPDLKRFFRYWNKAKKSVMDPAQ